MAENATPSLNEKVAGISRLQNQIMLATVGIILLFIAIPGVILIYFTQQRLEDYVLQERSIITRRIAQPIEATLEQRREEMNAALVIETSSDDDKSALVEAFTDLLRWNPDFLELALFDTDGNLLVAVGGDRQLSAAPAVIRQANWFRSAADGQPYVTLITFSEQEHYVILSQSAGSGLVMVSRLNTAFLQDAVEQLRVSNEDDRIYVFTTDRQLIADTLIPPELTPLGVNIPSTVLNASHPYLGEYASSAQGLVLGATYPIENTNWVVANEVRSSTALSDVRRAVRIGIALLVLGMVFTILTGLLVARHITSPLLSLVEFAHGIEDGQYQQPLPIQSPTELGVLARALHRMGQVIAEREETLRSTNATLQSRSAELAALSRQVIYVQEEERRRVSRELHDGFGQTLAALKMTLDVAQKVEDQNRKSAMMVEARQITELAINEVHAISQDLRPTVLDDLGLEATLVWYLGQFEQRFGIEVKYQFEPGAANRLSPESEITAYRFVQEALTNVYKHAYATQVQVALRLHTDWIMLSVKDNGAGFEVKPVKITDLHMSTGLQGLRERLKIVGGEFTVESQPGHGTTLVALLPQLPAAL